MLDIPALDPPQCSTVTSQPITSHQCVYHRSLLLSGVAELDQILTVLLSTEMFVGGFLAFCLDNTIPGSTHTVKEISDWWWRSSAAPKTVVICFPLGTREERGLVEWTSFSSSSLSSSSSYDLPLVTPFIRRISWLRWFPISPSFTGFRASEKDDLKKEVEENTDPIITRVWLWCHQPLWYHYLPLRCHPSLTSWSATVMSPSQCKKKTQNQSCLKEMKILEFFFTESKI